MSDSDFVPTDESDVSDFEDVEPPTSQVVIDVATSDEDVTPPTSPVTIDLTIDFSDFEDATPPVAKSKSTKKRKRPASSKLDYRKENWTKEQDIKLIDMRLSSKEYLSWDVVAEAVNKEKGPIRLQTDRGCSCRWIRLKRQAQEEPHKLPTHILTTFRPQDIGKYCARTDYWTKEQDLKMIELKLSCKDISWDAIAKAVNKEKGPSTTDRG